MSKFHLFVPIASISLISPTLSISFMVRFILMVFFIHSIHLKYKFHLCNFYVNHMRCFIPYSHFHWYQFDQIGSFHPYGKVIHVKIFIIIIITFTISIHMVWCHPFNEFHSHGKLISSMSSSFIEFHYSSMPLIISFCNIWNLSLILTNFKFHPHLQYWYGPISAMCEFHTYNLQHKVINFISSTTPFGQFDYFWMLQLHHYFYPTYECHQFDWVL